jgi:Icc-related predicted phosphoesterase
MIKSLYVISDTHDDLEAVARAVDFAKSEGRQGSRIVHVGDLSLRPYTLETLQKAQRQEINAQGFLQETRQHTDSVLNAYKEILENSGMPFTVIPGNYDGNLTPVFGNNNIHNKADDWNGIKIIGYGGAGDKDGEWIGPPHMNPMIQLEQIQLFKASELEKLLKEEKPTIAVVHNPPSGYCDDMFNGQNVGNTIVRSYFEENPGLKLILSGHIHEAGPNANNPNNVQGIKGFSRKEGELTLVVNPGNLGRFEILNPQRLSPEMQFDYGTFSRVDIEDDGTPIKVKQYSVQDNGRTIGNVKELREFTI